MHGHNWNVSSFLPRKSYIWYFMVGEPPTSSIQWIRTWKWRIHTSPSWWWSEQIFFLLCLFCIVFPCNEKKKPQGLFLATSTNTNGFTRFVPFFFHCQWQQLRSGHVKEDEWIKYSAGKARRWEDSYIQLGQTRVTNRHHEGEGKMMGVVTV